MRPAGGAPRTSEPRREVHTEAARKGARRESFAETLRTAADAVAGKALSGGAPAPRSALARRAAADDEDAALAGRRTAAVDDPRAAAPPPPPHAPGAAATDIGAVAPPELRALVRVLPVAVDASRLREGAPLSLSFGRSLDVELRPAAGGVELVLRPDPRLTRACEAELPRVLAALAARGVSVARARVHARGAGGAGAGARVDLPAALR